MPRPRPKKPDWLKVRLKTTPQAAEVERAITRHGLHTVCQEALCPNRSECYGHGTATFLLLGGVCTRGCTFCNVTKGKVEPLNLNEPEETAAAAAELGLKFVVLTSVTRDDQPDGGADIFARTIRALRDRIDGVQVEVLIPDFRGDRAALAKVIEARPDVLNHNVETIPRLYPALRPQADFRRSVELLARAKEMAPDQATKSGLMVGLGETEDELKVCFADLVEAEVDILTIGQYLPPSAKHHPLVRYAHPDEFARLKEIALAMGFKSCASGPLVRSSYQAHVSYRETTEGRAV